MRSGHETLRVVLTGGGTAGHVMPNLALAPDLVASGFELHYVGSAGVEKNLISASGLPFHEITCGKLRRYFSVQNFLDLFKVALGVFQAFFVLLKIRPRVVFSKGGFVAVPVAVAARLLGIPVVSHESDVTPGLANRIIAKFASKLLFSFPETARYVSAAKGQLVTAPIRAELFTGNAERGRALCGFSSGYPVILVMGGSQGAQKLNDALLEILPKLVEKYQIVHLTGKGKDIGFRHERYKAFEFVGSEIKDIFAMSDFAVSRAGANSIFEMLSLRIPMLLIPLEVGSRGDQILNAESFVKNGWAEVFRESTMTPESLLNAVNDLAARRQEIRAKQAASAANQGNAVIVGILKSIAIAAQ